MSVISRRLHDAMSRLMLSGDSRPLSHPVRQHSLRENATAEATPGAATPQPFVSVAREGAAAVEVAAARLGRRPGRAARAGRRVESARELPAKSLADASADGKFSARRAAEAAAPAAAQSLAAAPAK